VGNHHAGVPVAQTCGPLLAWLFDLADPAAPVLAAKQMVRPRRHAGQFAVDLRQGHPSRLKRADQCGRKFAHVPQTIPSLPKIARRSTDITALCRPTTISSGHVNQASDGPASNSSRQKAAGLPSFHGFRFARQFYRPAWPSTTAENCGGTCWNISDELAQGVS